MIGDPVSARNKSENRCGRCWLFQPLCICAQIPRLELGTRLRVLMHRRELALTTNTAQLACLALPNSDLQVIGNEGAPLDFDELAPLGSDCALLYPCEDAIELNEETAREFPRPLTLIVPDGSWRQARRIAHRVEALKHVRHVKLAPADASVYRLRHSPHEGHLATFEAISRTLGLLEGPEVQSQLDRLFLTMVERRLWSRGQLHVSKCSTGIPEAAFEVMREAGIRGGAQPRVSI